MNHDQPRPKVTVEDLLRVKRAERPPAEFWVRFERELRAKQLAAIVTKRPWWHAMPRAFAGMSRLHLPLGATAVLAITVFTVREYHRPSAIQETILPVAMPAMVPVAPLTVAANLAAPAMMPAAMTATMSENPVARESVEISNVRPDEISQVISMLGPDSRLDGGRDATPSARFIAANLAKIQMSEPDLVPAFGNTLGFETRGLPARADVTEPLAHVSTPKDRRSARYQESALPAGYLFETAAARRIEPVRNRINDRQLRDDSISRIGVDNGGVFLKM